MLNCVTISLIIGFNFFVQSYLRSVKFQITSGSTIMIKFKSISLHLGKLGYVSLASGNRLNSETFNVLKFT